VFRAFFGGAECPREAPHPAPANPSPTPPLHPRPPPSPPRAPPPPHKPQTPTLGCNMKSVQVQSSFDLIIIRKQVQSKGWYILVAHTRENRRKPKITHQKRKVVNDPLYYLSARNEIESQEGKKWVVHQPKNQPLKYKLFRDK